MIMRQEAVRWTVGLCLLLCVQVQASTDSVPATNCIRTLRCQFGEYSCGFRDSVNWRRENSSTGFYQRYEYVEGTSTDLMSPTLCNGAVAVSFSCLIVTSDAMGQPAELHVLTECGDNTEGAPFVVHASQNVSYAWRNVNMTFPACSAGQSLNVVFRAVYALPGSILLLDNVHLDSESRQSVGGCMDKLLCQFEENNACGFLDSDNWKLEHGPSGYFQRYKYTDGTAMDLVSPQLCNRAIDVHFSCLILTTKATGLPPSELHVFRACDDDNAAGGAAFNVSANQNLSSAWKNVSVTLPACPTGQNPSVVFRAVYALPGSVIKLDNIRLENVHISTTISKPVTSASTRSSHAGSRHEVSTHSSTVSTPPQTTHSQMTSTLTAVPTSRRFSSTQATTLRQRTTSSSSLLVTSTPNQGITASTSVTYPARDSSLSSQRSSLLTSLLVTTSPRASDNIASSRSTADDLVSSGSTSSTLASSSARSVVTTASHQNGTSQGSDKTFSTKKSFVDKSLSSLQPLVTSQRVPPVTHSTRHPPVSQPFTPETQSPESSSDTVTESDSTSTIYSSDTVTESVSTSTIYSSDTVTESVSTSTIYSKQNSSSSSHPSTESSDTGSASSESQKSGNKHVIIGVVIGVCGAVVVLVVFIVVAFRQKLKTGFRRVKLAVCKEDRETLIKLKQRWARAESVY